MSVVDEAKALLVAEGYVVLKEKSYLAAQERQRIARIRQEDAEQRVADLDRWARADLIPNERHLRNRLNFVYGIAVAHGATPDELRGFECGCGLSSCTIGKPLPPEVTERPRCTSIFPPSATGPYSDGERPGWSGPVRCVLSLHEHDRHLNNGLAWTEPRASDLHASVSPEQTPSPAADSAHRGDYVTDGGTL